jgi:hypothetical protein
MYIIGLIFGTAEFVVNAWFFHGAFTLGGIWWCGPVVWVIYTSFLGSSLFTRIFHFLYISTVALTYEHFGLFYACVAFLVCMGLSELTGSEESDQGLS